MVMIFFVVSLSVVEGRRGARDYAEWERLRNQDSYFRLHSPHFNKYTVRRLSAHTTPNIALGIPGPSFDTS
ncbi:hypothetical protein C8F01DRAFT_1148219 [Mycena amicta]|nr:hypothetical protein C8F01DRAFT_1148219 [Mycena amicta]